jgi:hypothetical protein
VRQRRFLFLGERESEGREKAGKRGRIAQHTEHRIRKTARRGLLFQVGNQSRSTPRGTSNSQHKKKMCHGYLDPNTAPIVPQVRTASATCPENGHLGHVPLPHLLKPFVRDADFPDE